MDEKFMQIDNINYIINRLGKELWIQVYGHQNMNGADALFWAGLIPNEHMARVLKNTDWEHEIGSYSPGFVGYGSGDYVYNKYSGFEYEPLLFLRDFHGIKESHIEISEEFRLLNNLYYDHKENKYLNISDTGELEPVVKIEKENVYIKLSYLKRFAAVKQMGVALYFDIRFDSKNSLEEMGLNSKYGNHYASDCCFDFNYNNYDSIMSQNRSCSIIHGKKILFGVSIEECGYWPYDTQKDYEDFVVGIDDDGQEVKFTSDPDKLGNYFGANPDAPHYLTPVYFSKDVLNKYYSKPELYEVNDGHIRCQGLWLLRVDNLNKEYVSVYLGDLGRDIPQKEQVYWKSYNIIPDGKLSDAKFKRDFLAEFADPEIADMKFKLAFTRFRKKWAEKFGWDLFLELTEADKYNFEHLRIPISNSQVEFDGLTLSLVKTIIDSINEKALNKLIGNSEDLKGSISRLERYLGEQNLTGFEIHIKFLRDLQELRSTGSGHRKGKSYEKVTERFNLVNNNFVEVFEEILERSILFIDFLDQSLLHEASKQSK
ncbi:hypothetical protein [Brevibacillus parabrevis]|uniref:hypothetical protein n=1 Tax=Brevibacillus parabrevis TaxID=54914 RepID=UPI0028D34848|nr:hypothetical protein [Brevibacillus parabrevis]